MSILFTGCLGFIRNHSETSLPIEDQAEMQIVSLGTGLPDSAKSILGPRAKHSFEEMCKSSWCCLQQPQESKNLGR